MFLKLVCILYFAISAFALPHEIVIYSDYDQRGANITFDTKIEDLTPWREFLETARSYCVSTQSWYGFRHVDFEDHIYTLSIGCRNYTSFDFVNSIRHLGPSDTSIQALSLYNGTEGIFVGGKELIIETQAATNFDFVPSYFLLTGRTEWTIYSNNNFTGMSTCLKSGGNEYQGYNFLGIPFDVNSVLKGCPGV